MSSNGSLAVAGIDEAGRGPMIGPLIVCGVLVTEDRIPELEEIGVRDSKCLTPHRREVLYGLILETVDRISLRSIPARVIDDLRGRGTSLNQIEVDAFAEIVRELRPDRVYMDAADVDPHRFRDRVAASSGLQSDECQFVAEHRADRHNVVVAAASIIAKVRRDAVIRDLHGTYGDFGSGYPSDAKTVDFVRGLVTAGVPLPPIIRRTWKSVIRVLSASEHTQQRLP